jgi:hypothetical protein
MIASKKVDSSAIAVEASVAMMGNFSVRPASGLAERLCAALAKDSGISFPNPLV